MHTTTGHVFKLLITALLCAILSGGVTAQDAATSISIGENETGQVTDSSGAVLFAFTLGVPTSVNLQVLAITPGFAPTFRVLDPGGVVVLDAANPGTQAVAQATPNLSSPGAYTIEVRSANDTTGQFLLSVQAGAPLAPPQPLSAAQPIDGVVSTQMTRQAYSFSGSPDDVLVLTVRSTTDAAGPVVALRDADTSETLALDSAGLIGVDYRFPATARNYLVEITDSGGDVPEPFTICLATESDLAICSDAGEAVASPTVVVSAPTLTPTATPAAINPTDACQVTPARNVGINVRGGPGTNYRIVGSLLPAETGLVLGRLAAGSWYRVSVNGVLGWVAASVVSTGGSCSAVSIVAAPTPAPSAAPPANPQATEPPANDGSNGGDNNPGGGDNSGGNNNPSGGDNGGGSNGGGGSPGGVRQPPALNFTQEPPVLMQPRLDYSAPAIYGDVSLTPPDTVEVLVTGGGIVDISRIDMIDATGGNCSGFASPAPDLRVHFSNDPFHRLHLSVVDTHAYFKLVVRIPDGEFSCVDGTGPQFFAGDGTYDVWVASSSANTSVNATLRVSIHSPN